MYKVINFCCILTVSFLIALSVHFCFELFEWINNVKTIIVMRSIDCLAVVMFFNWLKSSSHCIPGIAIFAESTMSHSYRESIKPRGYILVIKMSSMCWPQKQYSHDCFLDCSPVVQYSVSGVNCYQLPTKHPIQLNISSRDYYAS